MLKRDSQLWQLAIKYSRRKYVNSKPIELSKDGSFVTFQSTIRGNTWTHDINSLSILLRK